MIKNAGPEALPVKDLASQESEKGLQTNGISGLNTSDLSKPVDLQSSSENKLPHQTSPEKSLSEKLYQKLQKKTALCGSTSYSMIWKPRTTPAGRLYYRLVASVPAP